MWNKISVLLFIFMLSSSSAFSAVVFEENFDSQADWSPSPGTNYQETSAACGSGDCSGQVPSGWSFYRTTGWWWPPTYNDTISISNLADRGGGGKSFIVYNESNSGSSGDGWGADGILSTLLSSEYPELYVRVWIRTQSGWQWPSSADQVVKQLRIGRYSGSGDVFSGGADEHVYPQVLYDPKNSNTYGVRMVVSPRGAPVDRFQLELDADPLMIDGNYNDPDTAGLYADGEWHRLDYRVKMNTYSGSWQSDGYLDVWWDGTLRYSNHTMPWNGSGMVDGVGWNYIGLGGNAMNQFTTEANRGEQWFAMDDLVVSTTVIPDDYVIGSGSTATNGSCATITAPVSQAPSNGCSAGTQSNTTFTGTSYTWDCLGSGDGATDDIGCSVAYEAPVASGAQVLNGYIFTGRKVYWSE